MWLERSVKRHIPTKMLEEISRQAAETLRLVFHVKLKRTGNLPMGSSLKWRLTLFDISHHFSHRGWTSARPTDSGHDIHLGVLLPRIGACLFLPRVL
jgi:hypothetical protein